jgi:hypothetical protein
MGLTTAFAGIAVVNTSVIECETGSSQSLDLGRDGVDDEVDAIPSAGLGCAAVGHRPPGRARRAAEQEAQVAADDVR